MDIPPEANRSSTSVGIPEVIELQLCALQESLQECKIDRSWQAPDNQ
jgi:hypothetical protein